MCAIASSRIKTSFQLLAITLFSIQVLRVFAFRHRITHLKYTRAYFQTSSYILVYVYKYMYTLYTRIFKSICRK